MKKYLLLFGVILFSVKIAIAQTISLTGMVKTSQGDLLHLAFVQDKESKQGVYTDSLGSFMLTVKPGATLHVTCLGYRDTLFKLKDDAPLVITLSPAVNITANTVNGADAGANQLARQEASDRIMFNTPVNGTTNAIPNLGRKPVAPPLPSETPGGRVKQPMPGQNGWTFVDGMAYNMAAQVPIPQGNSAITQGDAITTFSEKGETQGSRFFFKQWSHGYVINSQDSLLENPYFLLNYDKIGGNLLLTKDRVSAIAIYNDKVRSFTLFDELNQPHIFMIVPAIDKSHYVQVIADGDNYKIYKAIKTTFVKSNYVSDGVASSGNNYDEYQDDYSYYVLSVKTGQVQRTGLKKKVLMQTFAADQTKVNGYFKTNDGDIDDNYLAALGDYMNK